MAVHEKLENTDDCPLAPKPGELVWRTKVLRDFFRALTMCVSGYISYQKCNSLNQMFL